VESCQHRGLIESLSTLVRPEAIILPSCVPFEPVELTRFHDPRGVDHARELAFEALRLDPDKSTFRSEAEAGNKRMAIVGR
jgi:hypothetical protein